MNINERYKAMLANSVYGGTYMLVKN